MAGSNTLALAAGGLVVVALSFGAGILGASVGAPDTADRAPAPRSVPDTVVRSQIEEHERRIANLEEQVRVLDETANAALAKAQEVEDLRRELRNLRAAGPAVPAAPSSDQPTEIEAGDGAVGTQMTAEEREALEAEQRDKLRKQAGEIVARNAPGLLKQRLSRIADATAQGAADRRSQVYAETKQLAVQYNMTPQEEDRVREILTGTSEDSVRDIAPYLGGGLERADYSAIKDRLFALWDARDERMAEVLDEKELEEYQETQKEWRKVFGKALDDMDTARRNR